MVILTASVAAALRKRVALTVPFEAVVSRHQTSRGLACTSARALHPWTILTRGAGTLQTDRFFDLTQNPSARLRSAFE